MKTAEQPAAEIEKTEPVTVRDVRVDQVGLVNLLAAQHADPMKDAIKRTLALKGATVALGDRFRGLLVGGGTVQTISAELWLRLYERREITRAQCVAALSVNKAAATEAVSKSRLAEISEIAPATPQLRVTKIKEVPVTLADAVRQIAAALAD